MKITFLGTGAAEGVPALFCSCSVCELARKHHGKFVRRRCSVMINRNLLLDIGPDALWASVDFDILYDKIEYILLSHVHFDHACIYSMLLALPKYRNCNVNKKIMIIGSLSVYKMIQHELIKLREEASFWQVYFFYIIKPYETVEIGEYIVTTLPSDHDKYDQCLLFIISDRHNTIFYNTDTNMYNVKYKFKKIEKYIFDIVISDCTYGNSRNVKITDRHIGIYENIDLIKQFDENGMLTDNFYYILTHFSHDSICNYQEIANLAQRNKMIMAYDGLSISL